MNHMPYELMKSFILHLVLPLFYIPVTFTENQKHVKILKCIKNLFSIINILFVQNSIKMYLEVFEAFEKNCKFRCIETIATTLKQINEYNNNIITIIS